MKVTVICIILSVTLIFGIAIGMQIWKNNSPCEDFKYSSVQNLPVRCLEYYSIKAVR